MDTKERYIYGSAAPQIQQPEAPRKVGPERRRVRKVRTLSETAVIPKGRLFFGILAVTLVCFTVLYRYSELAELNYQMGQLTNQYEKLKDENRRLNVEIETSINLPRVEALAKEKLGMHKPEQYQIVLVSVPKNDYSVVVNQDYIDTKSNTDTSLLEKLISVIRMVLPKND